MDRETVIKVTNKRITDSLKVQDIVDLLYDYCIEQDASKTDIITQCIPRIVQMGHWQAYFDYALRYYQTKFSVIILLDVPQKIMTSLGEREIQKPIKAY